MELSSGAEGLLLPHWEKIVAAWGGKVPEFVSEEFIEKHLPLLQMPDEEEEIFRRAKRIIADCEAQAEKSLYIFVLYYGALVLKLQLHPALQSRAWGEDEGMAALLAALGGYPLIVENCRRRGIPEHYAVDAMQWLGGTVLTYKLSHNGIPGHPLPHLYWLKYHVDGEIYRIGRFEYLMHPVPDWVQWIFRSKDGVFAVLAAPGLKFDKNGLVTLDEPYVEASIEEDGFYITGIPCTVDGIARVDERLTIDRREFLPVCSPWDLVPSLHIPGGLRMDWADALDSMKAAKEFFKKYFKREIPMIVCGSWIFNPALERFAPNGNIARLRRETFNIPMVRWSDKGRDGMLFAFGRDDVDPTELPAENSLQKMLQEIFKAEGTLRTGAMFVLTCDLDKLGNMYYRTCAKVL